MTIIALTVHQTYMQLLGTVHAMYSNPCNGCFVFTFYCVLDVCTSKVVDSKADLV